MRGRGGGQLRQGDGVVLVRGRLNRGQDLNRGRRLHDRDGHVLTHSRLQRELSRGQHGGLSRGLDNTLFCLWHSHVRHDHVRHDHVRLRMTLLHSIRLQVQRLGGLGRLGGPGAVGGRVSEAGGQVGVGLAHHAKVDDVAEEKLATALEEGGDLLGRVGAAVLDEHRLLALAQQAQLVVDELRDHAVLHITPHDGNHVVFAHHVVERMVRGVEELVHVPADRVPQIHADLQHHHVTLLCLTTAHHSHCRVGTIGLAHTQGLHGDVVDVQVLAALQRRQREGDHALQLGVVLGVRRRGRTNQVLAALDPLDLTVAQRAPALLAVALQLQVLFVVAAGEEREGMQHVAENVLLALYHR